MASIPLTINNQVIDFPLPGAVPAEAWGEALVQFAQAVEAELSKTASPGAISRIEYDFTNNQTTFANIPGYAFSNPDVIAFTSEYSIVRDTGVAAMVEHGLLDGIKNPYGNWNFTRRITSGDDSGMTFDITIAGQLQYKSSNYVGSSTNRLTLRANTIVAD